MRYGRFDGRFRSNSETTSIRSATICRNWSGNIWSAWANRRLHTKAKRRAGSVDEGWGFLDWKGPVEGGKVAAYKIERRERPSDP